MARKQLVTQLQQVKEETKEEHTDWEELDLEFVQLSECALASTLHHSLKSLSG